MNSQIITAYKLLKILSLSGITDVCYAPGSRSAPLVLALNMLKDRVEISGHVLFDERSLGFFTLGKHSAGGKKAALFTTSGSAVVNLYPAVQQAANNHQSMIVITADRPDELLGCGANQTASQGEIFGKNAVFLGIGAANFALNEQKIEYQKAASMKVSGTSNGGSAYNTFITYVVTPQPHIQRPCDTE